MVINLAFSLFPIISKSFVIETDNSLNELDEIYSELSPIEQSDRYTIENTPYVLITCIEENFNNGINDLSFFVFCSDGWLLWD